MEKDDFLCRFCGKERHLKAGFPAADFQKNKKEGIP